MSDQGRPDEADVAKLNRLLNEWRERKGGLPLVRSQDIVPDATNREYMGLSLEHVHFIAANIAKEGFRARRGAEGHDIPVLVRDSVASQPGALSLSKWRQRVMENKGFPRVEVSETEFFTSLGNGHFSQALNLFRCRMRNLLTGQIMQEGNDRALVAALQDGVPSIVLRSETPRAVRKAISLLLNRLHHVRWDLGEDGELYLTTSLAGGDVSQFEAMSKVMDAEELSVLVRTKMGIDVNEAHDGYSSRLSNRANARRPQSKL